MIKTAVFRSMRPFAEVLRAACAALLPVVLSSFVTLSCVAGEGGMQPAGSQDHDMVVTDCHAGLERSYPTYSGGQPRTSLLRADRGSEEDYESALYAAFIIPIMNEKLHYEELVREKHLMGYMSLSERFLEVYRQHWAAVREDDLQEYLQDVSRPEQPAGLLFYWRSASTLLCAGLVMPNKKMLVDASPLQVERSTFAQTSVSKQEDSRLAIRRDVRRGANDTSQSMTVGQPTDLSAISEELIPGSIRQKIESNSLRSLVVDPIEGFGKVPFAALPITANNDRLVDFVDVTIGFDFLRDSRYKRSSAISNVYRKALVVGDPDLRGDPKWIFPKLPGARQEARDVAGMFDTKALIGAQATHYAVVKAITSRDSPSLIYLASHAVTGPINPQDGSFIALTGRPLLTREVEKFKLDSGPLVVLSACQTGLGKEFQVAHLEWLRPGIFLEPARSSSVYGTSTMTLRANSWMSS